MIKKKLVTCLLLTIVSLTTKAFAEPDPNFYVFLCFGQSNMESGGTNGGSGPDR